MMGEICYSGLCYGVVCWITLRFLLINWSLCPRAQTVERYFVNKDCTKLEAEFDRFLMERVTESTEFLAQFAFRFDSPGIRL
jgi:hypothetical protein